MLRIALVGAPHTGKSQLAAALTGALKASGWQAVVVVADTPALRADLARYDLTLLMGLETMAENKGPRGTPAMPAPVQEAREAADQSLRTALAGAAVPYRVVYGRGEERLAHALLAVESLLQRPGARLRRSEGPVSSGNAGSRAKAWVWACDKCSDPQCEHRLLSALLAQRASNV